MSQPTITGAGRLISFSQSNFLYLLRLVAYAVGKAARFDKFSAIYSEKSTKNVIVMGKPQISVR
jgi:hypothetical protein